MTGDEFRVLALGLSDAIELPHFDRTSFRIRNKIFATLAQDQGLACLMLKPEDQDVFVAMGKDAVYPVPNKWGEKGATYMDLKSADPGLVVDALQAAYAGKKG
ncbi:MAG: MmcQ/YjbR family DNA-binding protein [Saprospiraceae bacterium]|nr:MmcQ/YjbR family DNA-binding protein [Saprospiraceae bacterium]